MAVSSDFILFKGKIWRKVWCPQRPLSIFVVSLLCGQAFNNTSSWIFFKSFLWCIFASFLASNLCALCCNLPQSAPCCCTSNVSWSLLC
jgi:hypothetical protein